MNGIRENFRTVQQLYHDAFALQCQYCEHWDEGEIPRFDYGIRNMIWEDFRHEMPPEVPRVLEKRKMILIRSKLGFSSMLVFTETGDHPEFFGIGPFRENELDDNTFINLAAKFNLSSGIMMSVRQLYNSMPVVDATRLTSFTLHIMRHCFPDFDATGVEEITYLQNDRIVNPNEELISDYAFEFAVTYQKSMQAFFRCLDTGDVHGACTMMLEITDYIGLTQERNRRHFKNEALSLNSMCCARLLSNSSVHPASVLKVFRKMASDIELCTQTEELSQLIMRLVQLYCRLVQNLSYEDYSVLVRSAVQYITLHLAEELSLESVSSALDKNPSYLSRVFHEETGCTLTDFIHRARVQEARNLFEGTSLSIGEVASSVGIHDYSYFAKLFKKVTGISPRDYKRGKRL